MLFSPHLTFCLLLWLGNFHDETWASAPSLHLPHQRNIWGWGMPGTHTNWLCRSFHFALHRLVAVLPSKAPCPLLPPSQLMFPPVRWLPQGWKPFIFHHSLPGAVPSKSPSLYLFPFFFCPTQLCEDFLTILDIWDLLWCSVDVPWELSQVDVFWCICGRTWEPPHTALLLSWAILTVFTFFRTSFLPIWKWYYTFTLERKYSLCSFLLFGCILPDNDLDFALICQHSHVWIFL